jgi:FAD/FMN-containing dehydrogenase
MKVRNWNGRPTIENATLLPFQKGSLPEGPFCVRGNGRSYGDASLQERMLDGTGIKEQLDLDGDILTVSAGYTVSDILNYSVPKGYILPVIPGTQHATVGGMIAADVHGKNHETHGSIGRWIEEIHMQCTDGTFQQCSPETNHILFEATIGGLGLTGVVISAKIKLLPLKTTSFQQRVAIHDSLLSMIDALDKSTALYKTGWFDCFRMDQFLLIENTPTQQEEDLHSFQLKKATIAVPFRSLPFVQPLLMKIYNKRYAKRVSREDHVVGLDAVLFPLDRISNWNYLYGKNGFYQLQFSLPNEGIEHITAIMRDMTTSSFTPVLAVVKKHGSLTSPGTLSFPKPGFSFAFDFVYQNGIESFIHQLNTTVAKCGGRVYLVKDALLDPNTFEAMYPELLTFKQQLKELQVKGIASLLSNRLNITA